MSEIFIPQIDSNLRKFIVRMPESIQQASGILIFGKKIRSLIFTTDIAIIKNCNSDAILAVYPFTPQPVITQAILSTADIPVFCGIGGGLTQGKRVVNLGLHAEFQGSMAVVVNAPTSIETILRLRKTIDIPIVSTIVSKKKNIQELLDAGVNILNISGGPNTPELVKEIRKEFPTIPIIATGGNTEDSILKTIEAGANAISYTPPSIADIFTEKMQIYREHY